MQNTERVIGSQRQVVISSKDAVVTDLAELAKLARVRGWKPIGIRC
jgi:hypothetical protein